MDEMRNFRWLYKFARALHEHQASVPALVQTALTLFLRGAQAEHGCLVLFDANGHVQHAYMRGTAGDLWTMLLDNGALSFALTGKKSVVIDDVTVDRQWWVAGRGSAAGIAFVCDDVPRGALILLHPSERHFKPGLMQYLNEAADVLSVALMNKEQSPRLEPDMTYYHALYADSAVSTFVTDRFGIILEVNNRAQELFQCEESDFVGQHISQVIPVCEETVTAEQLRGISAGQLVEFNTTTQTATGDRLSVLASVRQLPENVDQMLVWTAHDLSIYEQFEQLRRDLAAMTYHDLRGPLLNINGSLSRLERILDDAAYPDAARGLLHIALHSGRQMARMVKSLLDIEQIENGNAVIKRKPVLLSGMLADVEDLVLPLIQDAHQTLTFDVEDDLPLLMVDGDMVMRVIVNLIENATKYTPEHSAIRVIVRLIEGVVQITVQDSGPGIPPEMQDMIFDKYTRIRQREAPTGVGLGLAFCRLAVEAHGGKIWVTSEKGQGAAFSFTLPVISQTAKTF